MNKEPEALFDNNTWHEVDLPQGKKAIRNLILSFYILFLEFVRSC